MLKVQACWYKGYRNVGDAVVVPIMERFGYKLDYVPNATNKKFLGIGSIMTWLRDGDTVWGTGCIREQQITRYNVNFLAVRGPLTRQQIAGSEVPPVYGDPALLLPLLYNPDMPVVYEVGYLPHYVDKALVDASNGLFIDVEGDWQTIVRQIKSCRRIVTSSLHGIILAEAYGVPVEWVKYSDKILGGQFKFHDYFLSTGRSLDYGPVPPPDADRILYMQRELIRTLGRLKNASCIVRGG